MGNDWNVKKKLSIVVSWIKMLRDKSFFFISFSFCLMKQRGWIWVLLSSLFLVSKVVILWGETRLRDVSIFVRWSQYKIDCNWVLVKCKDMNDNVKMNKKKNSLVRIFKALVLSTWILYTKYIIMLQNLFKTLVANLCKINK